ncbi:DeoR/GlpR family DNA-binding transcription regulator [Barrientosiimonas endolithica]|uniref:Transcriptional regulator n=1 Tax=Barrientosiimonas endolithica TaxID=1535208 RepID=A0ABN6YRL5_9MICO|nr:DeoR/GlpR family DNA-binding transcription regulator [Barrientosiimonas endolithica]BDZ58800.1 transcriptional regulator [Barrientosiimonas endolithica]
MTPAQPDAPGVPGPNEPDQQTRWRQLLDVLAVRQRLSVKEGSELLGVSAATVRRDFRELAARQLATRTHGGVVATSVAYELPARYRLAEDDPRERIARAAAASVTPGSVIGFNGGTTTSAVARHVAQRAELQEGGVTTVTNALNIATELVLRPYIRTICIGGEARPESYELHGPYASMVLRDLLVERLFLGVDAVSAQAGVSCRHLGEASINAEMVRAAERVVVVGAGAKVGRRSLARICPTVDVHELITDDTADPEEVERIRELGVEVTLV